MNRLSPSEEHRPDVVILDLAMPQMNGIEATRQIRKVSPRSRMLILTTYAEEETVMTAIQAGASGFLSKRNASGELIDSVRAVRRGVCLPQNILRQLKHRGFDPLAPGNNRSTCRELTTRETEVLQAIADGFSNKEIATQLQISVKTIEKHRQRLMDKLNLHESAGLTRYALAHNYVPMKPAEEQEQEPSKTTIPSK